MPRTRAFRPEDLHAVRLVGDVRCAPDGSRVAFTVTSLPADAERPHSAVWTAATDGSGARPFTSGPADNLGRWSPDGRTLAFVGDRGKGRRPHLASLDGGDPRPVLDLPPGASALAWSPDGTRLAVAAPVVEAAPAVDAPVSERLAPRVVTTLRVRLDGVGWVDRGRNHLFVVDVATLEVRQVTDGEFDDSQPAWSPDSTAIAFVSDRRPEADDEQLRGDVWIVPAKGGRAKRLTAAKGTAKAPTFSPEGTEIAYLGGEDGGGFWSAELDVRTVPATGGPSRVVADGVHRLAAPGGQELAWTADGALLHLRAERGALQLASVKATGGLVTAVRGGDATISSFDLSADGRTLVTTESWVDRLPEVRAGQRKPKGTAVETEAITALNTELAAAVHLAPATRVTSIGPDGEVTESFLLMPAKLGKGPLPLAVEVHGGPHGWHPSSTGPQWSLHQSLAAAGYAVLLPNPRGSAGYGPKVLAGTVGDWGGGDADDVEAAVDALVADGTADPEQLNILGYSYGGYLGSWLIGHTTRYRSAVIGAPVTDLVSMFGNGDIPFFTAHEVGAYPWERPDLYAQHSPLSYAGHVTTPTLLVHHEGDLRCPVGQSEQLFTALRVRGVEVELVRYPGGSHGTGAPFQWVDRVTRSVAWVLAHA